MFTDYSRIARSLSSFRRDVQKQMLSIIRYKGMGENIRTIHFVRETIKNV